MYNDAMALLLHPSPHDKARHDLVSNITPSKTPDYRPNVDKDDQPRDIQLSS